MRAVGIVVVAGALGVATLVAPSAALATAPSVSTHSPSGGPLAGGTPVTYTGSGLSAVMHVMFGPTTEATITSKTDAQLVVTSPAGTGTVSAFLEDSNFTVLATVTSSFTYAAAPTVTGISTPSGPVGTAVTIGGTGFASGATVAIGGVTCTSPTFGSATSLSCFTGQGTTLGTPLSVTVTNPDTQTGTLPAGFTNTAPVVAAPTVASIAPTSGPVGTRVTIAGTGFTTGATVKIGDVTCTSPTRTSATQLKCTTGSGTPGLVDVVVTNPDTQTGTKTNAFTNTAPAAAPTVSSIAPTSGPAGTPVTITGTGFTTGATVALGGVTCTSPHLVSATSVTCTTGSGATGTPVDVAVMNTDSQTGTLASGFTNTEPPAPTVSSINPATGAVGTPVTITGTGFVSGATVDIGGVPCASPTRTSATQLKCTTGLGTPGLVDVVVTNPDTQIGTLPSAFTNRIETADEVLARCNAVLAGGFSAFMTANTTETRLGARVFPSIGADVAEMAHLLTARSACIAAGPRSANVSTHSANAGRSTGTLVGVMTFTVNGGKSCRASVSDGIAACRIKSKFKGAPVLGVSFAGSLDGVAIDTSVAPRPIKLSSMVVNSAKIVNKGKKHTLRVTGAAKTAGKKVKILGKVGNKFKPLGTATVTRSGIWTFNKKIKTSTLDIRASFPGKTVNLSLPL